MSKSTIWTPGKICYYAEGIQLNIGIFCGFDESGDALVFQTYPKKFQLNSVPGEHGRLFACFSKSTDDLFLSVWDLIEHLITNLRGNLQGQLLNIPFNMPKCVNCKHCNPATDKETPYLKCDLPGGPFPIVEHTITCSSFSLRDNLKKKQENLEP